MLPNLSDLVLKENVKEDDLMDSIGFEPLSVTFETLVLQNRRAFAVDRPTDAPKLVKALQATVSGFCNSGQSYNRFCKVLLPTYLKREVQRIPNLLAELHNDARNANPDKPLRNLEREQGHEYVWNV